jgi:hypothetical protein
MRPVTVFTAVCLFQQVIVGLAFHSILGHQGRPRSAPIRSRPLGSGIGSSFSKSAEKSQLQNESTQDPALLAAIAALQRLKARQETELAETIKMLTMVERQEYEKSEADDDDTDAGSSTAASLLSGFNYGFLSRSEGAPATLVSSVGGMLQSIYSGPPGNIFNVGSQQFMRNLNAMRGEYADEPPVLLTPRQAILHEKLQLLTLNTTEIWRREFADGPLVAPLIIKVPYLAVCFLLDGLFDGKYVPSRFFLLETGAWWGTTILPVPAL